MPLYQTSCRKAIKDGPFLKQSATKNRNIKKIKILSLKKNYYWMNDIEALNENFF